MMYWICVCCFHDCMCMCMDMDVLIWVLEWCFFNLCMLFSWLYLYVYGYKWINLSVKIKFFEVFVCDVMCMYAFESYYVVFIECRFDLIFLWLDMNVLIWVLEWCFCIDLSVRMMLFEVFVMCVYAFESLYVVLVECTFDWICFMDMNILIWVLMFFEVFVCVCMHLNICMLFSLNVFFILFVCVNMNIFFGVFM